MLLLDFTATGLAIIVDMSSIFNFQTCISIHYTLELTREYISIPFHSHLVTFDSIIIAN